LLSLPIDTLVQKLATVPVDIQMKVRNNGGGHYNHTLFWELMTPGGATSPTGELLAAIEKEYL
jgi:Fe-Mn family superoxide dismutase